MSYARQRRLAVLSRFVNADTQFVKYTSERNIIVLRHAYVKAT